MPPISFTLLLDFNNWADYTQLVAALLCLLLQLSFTFWRDGGRQLRQDFDGMALWLSAFVLWALLSSLWAAHPHGSLLHSVPLLVWLLGYLTMRGMLRTWPRQRVLGILALPVSAAAIFQIAQVPGAIHRQGGWFLDPNLFAAFLNAFFFPMLFWHFHLLKEKQFSRAALLALLMLVMFASQVLTFSAMGLLVLFAGTAVALGFIALRYRLQVLKTIPLLLALVAAFAALQQLDSETILSPSERAAQLDADSSLQARGMLYGAAWQLYQESPVVGRGFGMFALLYARVRDPAEQGAGTYVHSDPLQMLLEGGPLLLLLFAGPALYTVTQLWRSRPRLGEEQPSSLPKSLGQGAAFGLLALYAHSLVNFVFVHCVVALTAGIFLALVKSTLAEPQLPRVEATNPSPRVKLAILAGLLSLWGYLGFVVVDGLGFILLDAKNCRSAWCSRWQPEPAERHQAALTLSALQPDALAPRVVLVNTSLYFADQLSAEHPQRALLLANALHEAHELVRRQPQLPQAYFTLASLLVKRPELLQSSPIGLLSDPELLFLRTLELNPLDMQAYLSLYGLYASRGDYKKGYDLLTERALRWYSPFFMRPEQAEAVLYNAMQAAIRLNRHDDARDLAETLLRGAPWHEEARTYLRSTSARSAGEGLSRPSAAP